MDKLEVIHQSAVRIFQTLEKLYGAEGFNEVKPDLIVILEASRLELKPKPVASPPPSKAPEKPEPVKEIPKKANVPDKKRWRK